MLNLNTRLSIQDIAKVQEYTNLRLREPTKIKMAQALAVYEQRYLEPEEIKYLCEEAEGITLYEPLVSYVPESIVQKLQGTGIVPVNYLSSQNFVTCVNLPGTDIPVFDGSVRMTVLPTTLHYYLQHYQYYYGRHEMLRDVPVAWILESIVQEAIDIGAADITISTLGNSARVYYNVRKRTLESRRVFAAEDIRDVILYLCVESPYVWGTRTPKYVDVDLTKEFRGRVVINAKQAGYTITIRLLPNKAFEADITELSLTASTAEWISKNILDEEAGLRLIVGETMSGKNTTALALLREIVREGVRKVVSVEMPVEQVLPGVEQINTETVQEYSENIKSLIHQNPDFVYITEIRDATGLNTVQITNTGKRVLSTLHANSVADTLSRLMDITGLSLDRIVQTLHTVVYQKLMRDDEKDIVYPRARYVRFTDELKYELYGRTLGEAIKIIRREERGDNELVKLCGDK